MADEPLTMEQVKTHLRLGSSDREDGYLSILTGAALGAIEHATDRDIRGGWENLTDREKEVTRQAALLLIGQWYANREAVGVNVTAIPLAVQWLINPLRVMSA